MDAQLLMSGRSDEELPSHRDKEPMSTATAVAVLMAVATLVCVALLLVGVLAQGFFAMLISRPSDFSVTINGFSGLDDRRIPRAFNLTLGIDNTGDTMFETCLDGEAVVLYGGVPLAVGDVEELCVPRRGAGELAVVAASGSVGVPKALAVLMAGEAQLVFVLHGSAGPGGSAPVAVQEVTFGR